jgi:hypothetical protein
VFNEVRGKLVSAIVRRNSFEATGLHRDRIITLINRVKQNQTMRNLQEIIREYAIHFPQMDLFIYLFHFNNFISNSNYIFSSVCLIYLDL